MIKYKDEVYYANFCDVDDFELLIKNDININNNSINFNNSDDTIIQ